MGAWVNFLRSTGQEATGSFGWVTMGEHRGFAIAGELHAEDGGQYRVGCEAGYVRGFGAAGDPEPWQELAQLLIADERPEVQIALATAFAAPLVEFTELSSTAVSIRSSMSGVGKTSAMRAAKAVWGDPDFMSQASDTPTYVEATLAAQTNMPWYWDELRSSDHDQQLSNTIYQVLQGKSKGRGSSDGGAKPTLRTRGMLVMASNLSLHEIMKSAGLGTDAGSYRILEVDIPPRKVAASNTEFNRAMAKLKNNYGHAGVIYASYLATHREEVSKLVEGISAAVDREYEALQAERYWLAAVKTILAGAILANRAGICKFDVVRMNTHLKQLITTARLQVRDTVNGEDIVGQIWRTFGNQTVVTDHFTWNRSRGRPTGGVDETWQPQNGQPGQFGPLGLRLAAKDNTLAVTVEIIMEYAKRNKLHPPVVIDQVANIPGCKKHRGTIDSNLNTNTGTRVGKQVMFIMNASAILGADEVQDWVVKKTTSAGARPAATPGSSSGTAPSGSTTP